MLRPGLRHINSLVPNSSKFSPITSFAYKMLMIPWTLSLADVHCSQTVSILGGCSGCSTHLLHQGGIWTPVPPWILTLLLRLLLHRPPWTPARLPWKHVGWARVWVCGHLDWVCVFFTSELKRSVGLFPQNPRTPFLPLTVHMLIFHPSHHDRNLKNHKSIL